MSAQYRLYLPHQPALLWYAYDLNHLSDAKRDAQKLADAAHEGVDILLVSMMGCGYEHFETVDHMTPRTEIAEMHEIESGANRTYTSEVKKAK